MDDLHPAETAPTTKTALTMFPGAVILPTTPCLSCRATQIITRAGWLVTVHAPNCTARDNPLLPS